MQRVYASKVLGADALQQVSITAKLQAYLLFSSVSALLGSAGQANYCAANACLDALASYRCAKATSSVSVQWGVWSEAGMGVHVLPLLRHQGMRGLWNDEALWAMEMAVQTGPRTPWSCFMKRFEW